MALFLWRFMRKCNVTTSPSRIIRGSHAALTPSQGIRDLFLENIFSPTKYRNVPVLQTSFGCINLWKRFNFCRRDELRGTILTRPSVHAERRRECKGRPICRLLSLAYNIIGDKMVYMRTQRCVQCVFLSRHP